MEDFGYLWNRQHQNEYFCCNNTPSNTLILNSIQDFRNGGINKRMASHALNQILGIKNL
jgi:hypothetical protein